MRGCSPRLQVTLHATELLVTNGPGNNGRLDQFEYVDPSALGRQGAILPQGETLQNARCSESRGMVPMPNGASQWNQAPSNTQIG